MRPQTTSASTAARPVRLDRRRTASRARAEDGRPAAARGTGPRAPAGEVPARGGLAPGRGALTPGRGVLAPGRGAGVRRESAMRRESGREAREGAAPGVAGGVVQLLL